MVWDEDEACGGRSWAEESLEGVAGAGEGAAIAGPIDYVIQQDCIRERVDILEVAFPLETQTPSPPRS